MQAHRAGDGHRRGRVPLVLTAGVQVGVCRTADDRRHLRAGGTQRHDRATQRLSHRGDQRGGPGPAGHQPRATTTGRRGRSDRGGGPGRYSGRPAGRQRDALRRERDSARGQLAVLPQRDVHRPVGAARLAELPGPVQRVNDPHPAGGEPGGVVDCLLGQDRVLAAVTGQRSRQQRLRTGVAGVPQRGGIGEPQLDADPQQQRARVGGQPRRQRGVIEHGNIGRQVADGRTTRCRTTGYGTTRYGSSGYGIIGWGIARGGPTRGGVCGYAGDFPAGARRPLAAHQRKCATDCDGRRRASPSPAAGYARQPLPSPVCVPPVRGPHCWSTKRVPRN